MAQSRKNSKSLVGMEGLKRSSKESTPDGINPTQPQISAPKYGTVIPDRVFVGGIASNTVTSELTEFFSNYGKVVDAKIILDRAGVSKGYGFITFASDEEVKHLLEDVRSRDIMLRERKLNIAPAIKKQSFNQRLDAASNGGGSVTSGPLFPGTGITYGTTFHNGVAYYSAPPATQAQPPPAAPHHIDPNLFTGYPLPATPAQYQPVLYNHAPIYFQHPQYAPYSLAYDGGDGSAMIEQGTPLVVGSYYLPDAVTGQPLFAAPAPPEYAPQYQPQPQYVQYTTPTPEAAIIHSPRRYYDQLLVPEGRGDKEDERKGAMAVVPVNVTPLLPKPSTNNNVELNNRNLHPHPNTISSSPQVPPYTVFQPRGPPPYQPSPATQYPANSAAASSYRRGKPSSFYQGGGGSGGSAGSGGIRKNGKRYSHGTGGSVSSYGSGGGGNSPLSTPRSSSDPAASSTPSTPPSNQQQTAQEALVTQMQALTA